MILKSASPSRRFVLSNSKRVFRSTGRNVRVVELGPLRSVFSDAARSSLRQRREAGESCGFDPVFHRASKN
jgi:hypothetical protein